MSNSDQRAKIASIVITFGGNTKSLSVVASNYHTSHVALRLQIW